MREQQLTTMTDTELELELILRMRQRKRLAETSQYDSLKEAQAQVDLVIAEIRRRKDNDH